eukprot:COSAG01_NODE_2603_length_7393_cov_39.196874_9_plen_98_part_00
MKLEPTIQPLQPQTGVTRNQSNFSFPPYVESHHSSVGIDLRECNLLLLIAVFWVGVRGDPPMLKAIEPPPSFPPTPRRYARGRREAHGFPPRQNWAA